MSFFPTNASQVQAFAGALYGVQVGSVTMAQVNNDIQGNGGLANTLNGYYSATFGGVSTATVASTVATNLGLTGDALTAGTAYITAQLNGAAAGARGAVVSNIVNLFSTLASDATFGAAATAWNTKVATAIAYTGATNVAIGSVVATSNVFTLTTGNDVADANSAFRGSLVDSFRFTSGNEGITAGISTLGAGDIFIDSSTSDVDVLNVTLSGSSGAFTAQNIETINVNMAAGTAVLDLTSVIGAKNVNLSGAVAGRVDGFNAAAASRVEFATNSYTNGATLRPATLAGTSTTAETINVTVTGASYGTTAATRSLITIDGNAGNGQLETLNLTSSGTTGNDYALTVANNATLGTVNLLGTADTTVRVTHGDITGVTLVGAGNTGNTIVRVDRNAAGTTPTASQNFSGVDKFQAQDTSGTDDAMNFSSIYSGAVVEALSGFTNSTITVTGSAARTTDSLTVNFDHATANTSVALGTLNVQDVETMNLVSTGNASALVGSGNTATITGDATTVTITGDTSLNLTIDVDAPATGSRTTVVNASAITGTATVTLNASGDASTTNLYNITGTGNADTLSGTAVAANTITGGEGNDSITGGVANDTVDLGNGDDRYTTTAGTDTITLGGGNDTIVIAATASQTTATAQVQTTGAITTVNGNALATGDTLFLSIGGITYTQVFATDVDTTGAALVTAQAANILSATGVTLAYVAATDSFTLTGAAAGTAFTAATLRVSDASVSTLVTYAASGTVTTPGVVAGTGDNRIADFSASTGNTDIFSLANLTLAAGGYFEGAVGDATAATDWTVMVLTGASYASEDAAQTAVAARLTSANNADGIVIYLDSALGYARAYYTDTIDGNSGENAIVDFTGITTLAGVASAFSAAQFGL
jgi:hypothetical protein